MAQKLKARATFASDIGSIFKFKNLKFFVSLVDLVTCYMNYC